MKKVLISSIILIFVLSMFNIVNAASGNIDLDVSSSRVKPGNVFTVTLVGTAENNITALQANLSYDTSKLTVEKKEAATGFADFSENNEISAAAINSDLLSKTATLYTITFKVLDDVKVGKTTINFKDISLAVKNENDEQEVIKASDDSVTVNIKLDETINNSGSSKLPQTGIGMTNIISIAILTLISILAYTSYKKYRKA